MEWGDAPARELAEAARLQPAYLMFADGRFTESGGATATVVNPATAEPLTVVNTAVPGDVDAALRPARRCYDRVWSRVPGAERAKYLFRVATLVENRARELAVLESLQSGTPLARTRDVEIPAVAAQVFHHGGWADKLRYAGLGPDPRPLGVAALLTWADTALPTAVGAVAAALACGNTVVLNPDPRAPLTALMLADICQQAELPAGALTVLPGGRDVGDALLGHSGVAAVTILGAPAHRGQDAQRALAGSGRRLSLDLRGATVIVVFDDAPLDQAVDAIVDIAFCAPHTGVRLLAQESVVEPLLDALRSRIAALRVGDPLDRNTEVGPVRSAARLDALRGAVDRAQDDGARCWAGPVDLPEQGFFAAPTLITGVAPAMRIAREEVAGPVLPVLTFRTPGEALAVAEHGVVGSVSVWTEKGSRLAWAAQRLHAGVVWANTAPRWGPGAPAGHHGQSGLGVGGGRQGLEAYLDG